jgi:hypothetical protein
MSDDLVERVARAMCGTHGYEPDDLTYREARAAIAVVLEEAAKVADAYDPRCDVCPRGVAAAIRALVKT